jgi:mannan endo-1,4-beta-mannosidase
VTADYLKQLADARVPVLWRPLHEIDGSWFWWTDAETPENTAALWRLMFDYFVNERELHNLIWVYNRKLTTELLSDHLSADEQERLSPAFETSSSC